MKDPCLARGAIYVHASICLQMPVDACKCLCPQRRSDWLRRTTCTVMSPPSFGLHFRGMRDLVIARRSRAVHCYPGPQALGKMRHIQMLHKANHYSIYIEESHRPTSTSLDHSKSSNFSNFLLSCLPSGILETSSTYTLTATALRVSGRPKKGSDVSSL